MSSTISSRSPPHAPLPPQPHPQTSLRLLRRPRPVSSGRTQNRSQHPLRLRRPPQDMRQPLRLAPRRGVPVQRHQQTASPRRRRIGRRTNPRPRPVGSQGHRRRPAKRDQIQSSRRLPPHQHPLPVPRPRRPLPGQPHRPRLRPHQNRKPHRNPPALLRPPSAPRSRLGRSRPQVLRKNPRPPRPRNQNPPTPAQQEPPPPPQ